MNQTIDFPKVIEKFDAILARGLCAGIGTPDGQVCIEVAITQALGLPFSDEPECVAASVRSFKITLNDSPYWISPESRAKGLRSLGIAQIGSKGAVDDVEFSKRMAEKTIRMLIPKLFREVLADYPACLEAADRCEKEGTAAAARAAAAAAAAGAGAGVAAGGESYLLLSALLALETLRELNSPGCNWVAEAR